MEKIPEIIHESWHKFLIPLFNDDRMKNIKYNLLPGRVFYPEPKNIFRVFSMPLDQIKVVILGQDPYPRPGDAIGYAFATIPERSVPKSLGIISREIENEGFEIDYYNDEWKTLQHWVDQGIFLLNTALTVLEGRAGSHLKPWRWFIEEIIKIISREVTPIWLLWGAKAHSFESIIRDAETFLFNDILKAPHPAAELYSGGKAGFYGCGHFKKVNELLTEKEQSLIKF